MADYKTFIKELEKKHGVKIKVKGGEVGKPNEFNYSLIILKKALVNYFVDKKSIYDTINENQELIDYQIIKKRSGKTKYLNMNTHKELPDKVLRLFPVTEGGMSIVTDTYKKVPEVPENAVLIKDNIQNMTIKDIPNFDINYYISAFNDKLDSWLNGTNSIEDDNFEFDNKDD